LSIHPSQHQSMIVGEFLPKSPVERHDKHVV